MEYKTIKDAQDKSGGNVLIWFVIIVGAIFMVSGKR